MTHLFKFRNWLSGLRQLGLWLVLVTPVAVLAGTASAVFLMSLEAVTQARFDHPWLLWLLPLAGILIVALYHHFGGNSERGNNLIIDEIHEPGGGVPVRIVPLVMGTTLITHLFGGSAGREGTAVQMGGGIAGGFVRLFGLTRHNRQMLLMAGVAAGFGSVFGTPLAGAVFAMEVITIGRLQYEMLIPCMLAGYIADFVCAWCGAHHTGYTIATQLHASPFHAGHLDLEVLVKVMVIGAACGLCARFFAELTHGISQLGKRFVSKYWLRPVIGAALVILITLALGTRSYLGIGTSSPNPGDITLTTLFQIGGADTWSWFWKLLLTAITLGTGFKGGEVTPLFFIGAALGHTAGLALGLPVDLAAGVGFIALFSGASNTPMACTLMGVELFGAEHTLLFASACFISYYFSGHGGIYSAQRVGVRKQGTGPVNLPLSALNAPRRIEGPPPMN